jgi:hypothetical protein
MDRAALEAHLRRIRILWNQKASGRGSLAQVCKQLLSADEELKRAPGDMADPGWWQAQQRAYEAKTKPAYDALVANLRQAYGATGRIPRVELNRVAASMTELGLDRVTAAAAAARLTVVDAVELPTSSGLDRTMYQTLRDQMGQIGAPTVVHLLHPAPTGPFTLLTTFAISGDPQARLDRATLDARADKAEKTADSPRARAVKSALGILRTGLSKGADLRTIALFHIVDQLRQAHLADALLVGQATNLGLAGDDAVRIVASLPSGGAPPRRVLDQIRDLLERGQLTGAEAVLAALPATDPDHATAKPLVDASRAQLDALVRDADAAVAAGREGEAERLLAKAAAIDAKDAGLTRLAERVPIAPPRQLSATPEGAAVRLAWRAPLSRAGQIRYRVLRTEGHAPASERDGVVVLETTELHADDTDPPLARDLRYGVFAVARGRPWSRAATAAVVVLPPVTDVELQVGTASVTGTWRTAPGVVETRVRRASRPPTSNDDGVAVLATQGSFTDHDVEEGTEYFYGIVAIYQDVAGRPLAAPMVVTSVVPRGDAQPVGDLTVQPIGTGSAGRSRVLLTWSDGGEVKIRRADEPPPWRPGEIVALRVVGGYGHEVVGRRQVVDGICSVEAEVPPGQHVYVPFAIGGSGAVVGASVASGVAEPVSGLAARRTDELVVLSWAWPDRVGVAEVTWVSASGEWRTRQISRAQYAEESGCRLPVGSGGTAEVRAMTTGPLGVVMSPPVRVSVSGPPVHLRYTVTRPPGVRNRLSRQRIVRLLADRVCTGLTVELVLATGHVMPARPAQGQVLVRAGGLTLAPDIPHDFVAEIPAGVRKPYWLRLFATEPAAGIAVVDPPIAEIKVS